MKLYFLKQSTKYDKITVKKTVDLCGYHAHSETCWYHHALDDAIPLGNQGT